MTANRSLGHVAVLLVDLPEVGDRDDLSWRDLPGFPVVGYQRAQVYLRQGGSPFAKLSLNLDDEGFPHDPLPALRATSTPVAPVAESSVDAASPLVSIVVSTAGLRPDLLRRCIQSLASLRYPNFEVIIIDNRSGATFDEGAEVWSESWLEPEQSAVKVSIVRERRPGLSHARNTGVQVAQGEIVAFTDDDVEVDSQWLHGIVDAFSSSSEVQCVTGLVIPAELETEAQELFEIFCSGFDRGFVPRSWRIPGRRSPNHTFLNRETFLVTESGSPEPAPPQSLYAAIGNCGVGANMAVRRAFALQYPFDVALGVGTVAQGGEDVRFYADVLWAGYGIRYVPNAIVRHTHRRDMAALESQMRGFGVGYTALIASLVLEDLRHLVGLTICGAPAAVVRWVRSAFSGPGGAQARDQEASYPASLRRNELIGMSLGPWRYALSRLRSRSLGRA
jgi:glycosyltransferase involved in cell wall biosynthesis